MTFQNSAYLLYHQDKTSLVISVQLAIHTRVKSLPVLLLADKRRQRGYNNKLQEVIQRKSHEAWRF